MVALFKELQPIDAYKIRMSQPFSEHDQKLLTLFYQPLIGSDAMSLFMTLWADADEKESEFTHYHLMNVLSMPLTPVFEARISLEAIGLLRTYTKMEVDQRTFLYELSPPLDAKAFFEDPLLSTFLFSKIGEQAYRSLRNRFLVTNLETASYTEVSRTFLDVYKPVNQRVDIEEGEGRFVGRAEANGVPFVQHNFDFDLLQSGLSEQMVPQSALAAVSRELIAKLAFLYSLSPLDMQKVMMMALDENLQIPEARLRRATADFYKMNTSKTPPVLDKTFTQTVPPLEKEEMERLTREEELIYYLENTPPVEMLRDLNGKEPMPVDVQLAERLINTHELSVGVVNVLLQFVFIRNDGKITKGYVERIASHWMNKKVSNAGEALEFSRKEHDKYMQWKNEESKPKSFNGRPVREELVPEWFQQDKEEKASPSVKKKAKEKPKKKVEKPKLDADLEERRRKLREELTRTRKGVK